MEIFFSYCLTEPGSGSDAAALKTKRRTHQRGLRADRHQGLHLGRRVFGRLCRDGPHRRGRPARHLGDVVEDGAGLSFGGLEDKMGWRSQPTRQVQFDACKVPPETSGRGRPRVSLRHGGAGRRAAEHRGLFAGRGAGGAGGDAGLHGRAQGLRQSIDQFQALQFRLADMEIDLQAARIFLRQAAWKLDTGAPDATKACAMAKKLVTEMGSRVADQCLQLHGGYGYLADYGIEKIVRDLRVHQILEGTNEIMRLIVARICWPRAGEPISSRKSCGKSAISRRGVARCETADLGARNGSRLEWPRACGLRRNAYFWKDEGDRDA
jgi:alkylation response protein AidB-like acyl-CoA dehydrogenase